MWILGPKQSKELFAAFNCELLFPGHKLIEGWPYMCAQINVSVIFDKVVINDQIRVINRIIYFPERLTSKTFIIWELYPNFILQYIFWDHKFTKVYHFSVNSIVPSCIWLKLKAKLHLVYKFVSVEVLNWCTTAILNSAKYVFISFGVWRFSGIIKFCLLLLTLVFLSPFQTTFGTFTTTDLKLDEFPRATRIRPATRYHQARPGPGQLFKIADVVK